MKVARPCQNKNYKKILQSREFPLPGGGYSTCETFGSHILIFLFRSIICCPGFPDPENFPRMGCTKYFATKVS